MYHERRTIEHALILAVDLIAVILSFILAVAVRYHTFIWIDAEGNQSQQIIIILILYTALHLIFDFYQNFFRRGKGEELRSIIREVIIFYVCLIVVYYLIHNVDALARLMILYMAIFHLFLAFALRLAFKYYMATTYKGGRHSSRMLVITKTPAARDIITNIQDSQEWNRTLMGVALIDRDKAPGQMRTIGGVPVAAGREDLLDMVIHNDVDEVFISYEGMEQDQYIRDMISEMQMMGILVNVDIAAFQLIDHGKKMLNKVGSYMVVAFARNVIPIPGQIAKRLLDIIGSLVGMVILGIASIFIVPAIKMDSPGPALFVQKRVGKNGRVFKLYKFRSMYQDAEERKKQLMEQNEVEGLMFKMDNDPRITKVGKFLRRTSLDELPQFWNILKGDMSLVGTRPPTLDEFLQYKAHHKARLSMTPGLTGLWQVSGRSDIKDFEKVVKLDMEYIDNWSIREDIRILFKTVSVVFKKEGSK